jgi:hypothetical protein
MKARSEKVKKQEPEIRSDWIFSLLGLLVSLFLCLSNLGCSTSQDFNPSMDFNPGWDNDRHTVTTFHQLPRHKNRLEHGIQ